MGHTGHAGAAISPKHVERIPSRNQALSSSTARVVCQHLRRFLSALPTSRLRGLLLRKRMPCQPHLPWRAQRGRISQPLASIATAVDHNEALPDQSRGMIRPLHWSIPLHLNPSTCIRRGVVNIEILTRRNYPVVAFTSVEDHALSHACNGVVAPGARGRALRV